MFAAYQHLLESPEQLALCQRAESLPQLLSVIRQFLQWQATDEQVLRELHACNQQISAVAPALLARSWLPYSYNARNRSLSWCIPAGRATEPFHDQFISRSRQALLINQLIQPRTALEPLAIETNKPPAGCIFHLSRCGSTLMSGCLAEIEQASVLSESPLLTEFLLDDTLTAIEKKRFIPALIHLQAGSGRRAAHQAIIKWNAWDILQWSLLRECFPDTPVVLLIRNPLEILASHQRSSGRHMSGEPSLISLDPIFGRKLAPLDFRINVLDKLQNAMLAVSAEAGVQVVDYTQLNASNIKRLSAFFKMNCSDDEVVRIKQRMTCHSKEPERKFESDSQYKQHCVSTDDQQKIRTILMPGYEQLLSRCLN